MASEKLEKLRERSIAKLDDDAALEHVGELIDASHDACFGRGLDRALYLLDELAKREFSFDERLASRRDPIISAPKAIPASCRRVGNQLLPSPQSIPEGQEFHAQ